MMHLHNSTQSSTGPLLSSLSAFQHHNNNQLFGINTPSNNQHNNPQFHDSNNYHQQYHQQQPQQKFMLNNSLEASPSTSVISSHQNSASPVSQGKIQKKKELLCDVCGDVALGKHYGVYACNGESLFLISLLGSYSISG